MDYINCGSFTGSFTGWQQMRFFLFHSEGFFLFALFTRRNRCFINNEIINRLCGVKGSGNWNLLKFNAPVDWNSIYEWWVLSISGLQSGWIILREYLREFLLKAINCSISSNNVTHFVMIHVLWLNKSRKFFPQICSKTSPINHQWCHSKALLHAVIVSFHMSNKFSHPTFSPHQDNDQVLPRRTVAAP